MGQLNLYILSENALVVCGLKHYLEHRFGSRLKIFNFYNRKACMRKINKQTSVVVVDQIFHGTNGAEVQRFIKTINPHVEVIMHSSGEEVATTLSSLCNEDPMRVKQEFKLWLQN
jgi:DNA-binding NarL/FixJ family response regulator